MKTAISVEKLTVNAAGTRILDDVSFEAYENEYIAVVGSSGSGKTTLMNYMVGEPYGGDACHEGSIKYGDTSILDLKGKQKAEFRGEHIGVVTQKIFLPSEATMAFAIRYAAEMRGARVDEALVGDAVSILGLKGMEDRKIRTLSGGEQKRASIVRALAHNPSVLLFDEPAGPLNPALKEQVDQMLGSLARNLGKTVLSVTHEEKTTADRVLRIESGKIVT